MRTLIAATLLTLAFTVEAQLLSSKLYAVIFDVTTDASGKIDTLKISKVIDPTSGTTDPVDVVVPQEYVHAARAQFLKRAYKAGDHFFTYSFYDPARPSKADIDPKTERR